MSKYYEVEAVKEVIERLIKEPAYQHEDEDYYAGVSNVESQLQMLPITEAVSKSEMEYWKEQCFHACMNNGCLDKSIKDEAIMRLVKKEVAKKIFEEIDKLLVRNEFRNYEPCNVDSYYYGELSSDIAKLKKEYMEEKE